MVRPIHNIFEFEDFAKERMKAESTPSALALRSPDFAKPLPNNFDMKPIKHEFNRPPTLKHGLDRIVRTDGIYTSEVMAKAYGSDFLKLISAPSSEVLDRFPAYTPPSRDRKLLAAATETKSRFLTGSSSITDELMHVYFLMSNFKSPDMTGLGKNYDLKGMMYMSAYRRPTSFMLRKLGPDMYAVDGDSGLLPASNIALTEMGVVLEALLTTEESLYKKIIDPKSGMSKEDIAEALKGGNSHRMRKIGNMVVRSQIDCESTSATGENFVFEIKTRATAPIRYDVKNIPLYFDYKITRRSGVHESFEREYFDLIRSILIKYYFQIKLGFMDGAFLCYHNTKEIFGYQYILLSEIEKRVFGSKECGERMFLLAMQIHQLLLEEVVRLFPEPEMLRVGFYSDYRREEMTITVEEFDTRTDWKESDKAVEGIEDEHDYYTIFSPGKKAYALRLHLFPFLNGIYQREPIFYEPGDKFEVLYNLEMKGVINFEEYMYFLHNAFKLDSMTFFKEYTGSWKRLNDFHAYRKPLHTSKSGL